VICRVVFAFVGQGFSLAEQMRKSRNPKGLPYKRDILLCAKGYKITRGFRGRADLKGGTLK